MHARRPLGARFAPETTADGPRPARRRSVPSRDTRAAVRRALRGTVDPGFRPDIEGLRAVAVGAVVLYHTHLLGVRSGFVGVDVFFVVSGYLITRLLLGEAGRTGTVALPEFWARRARRLLPAAALTVVVTVLVARRVLPPLALPDLAADTFGAATFTSNFVFGSRVGDYFAPGTTSPLLHFWSLAVEEQFYLLWPPLLVVLMRRPRQYRRLLLVVTTVLIVAGFATSLALDASHSTWAFWLLPTRMGELLAGAVLAIGGWRLTGRTTRAAVGWCGLVGIVVACFAFDGVPTSWPGLGVLLPVLSTVAVVLAGSGGHRPVGAAVVLGRPALQWIGRHSYALYLWHWPAYVLAEAQWGPLSIAQRVGVVALSVAVSAASVRFVEDPVRHARRLAAVPARSLALGVALVLVVALVGWNARSSVGRLDGGVEAAAPQLVTTAPTDSPAAAFAGAGATGATTTVAAVTNVTNVTTATTTTPAPDATIAPVQASPSAAVAQLVSSGQGALRSSSSGARPVPSNLRPSLAGATERSTPYRDGCVNVAANHALQPCEYGVPGGPTLLLFGDSHAAQWFEPIEQYALRNGYRLVVLLKMGCPVADVDFSGQVLPYTCPPWRDRAIAWITTNQPDLVVVSSSYVQYGSDADEWAQGSEATFGRLADAVDAPVVVFGDNPASPVEVPVCLSGSLDDASACDTSREEATRPDLVAAEFAAAQRFGFTFVDTTEWFCTDDNCPAVVGNILVLRDESHITAPMALYLQPLVDAVLAAA